MLWLCWLQCSFLGSERLVQFVLPNSGVSGLLLRAGGWPQFQKGAHRRRPAPQRRRLRRDGSACGESDCRGAQEMKGTRVMLAKLTASFACAFVWLGVAHAQFGRGTPEWGTSGGDAH